MLPRQVQLLDFIIREYIKTAKPIGSSLVCKKSRFRLSPATIRNEMYDLEERGYLVQLHTSGGRIPTDRAYRYFVEYLIDEELEPTATIRKKINLTLKENMSSPREMNKSIAQLISEFSDNLVITNIAEDDDFYKIGLSSLFEMPEFRQFEKMFKLTSLFDDFETIFSRMAREFFGEVDVSINDSVQMYIGRENPIKDIRDETVILAKYNLPGNHTGSLTIIGPTRMDYEKNISLVKCLKEELNKFI